MSEKRSRDEQWRLDRELILRFQAAAPGRERERAFEPLVARYGPMVLRRCAIGLAPDGGAAEEAAADTWVEAYTALYRLRDPRAAVNYLREIAHRQVIRRYRAAPRRMELPSADAVEDRERTRARSDRAESDHGFAIREQELLRLLEALVPTLPEGEQRLYDLVVRQGMEVSELAQALGVSRQIASRRLYDHRQYLKEAFGATVLVLSGNGCADIRGVKAVASFRKAASRMSVMPATLRWKVVQHISDCAKCGHWCKENGFWWILALVPPLFLAGLHRNVMGRVRLVSNTEAVTGPAVTARSPAPPTRRRSSRRAPAARPPSTRRSPSGPGRNGWEWGPVAAVVLVGGLLTAVLAVGGAFRQTGLGVLAAEPASPKPSTVSKAPGRVKPTRPGTGGRRPGHADAGSGRGATGGADSSEGDGSDRSGPAGRGDGGGRLPDGTNRSGSGGRAGSGPDGSGGGGSGNGSDGSDGGGSGSDSDGSGGGGSGSDSDGSPGGGPYVPAERPADHTVEVRIDGASDPTVASYGIDVTVAGTARPRCQGLNAQCLYTVPHGGTIEVRLPGNSRVPSWGGQAPCKSGQTTCAFTVTANMSMPLRLAYEPG
ncbi:sigma-70 family RNA polymerase sigma factor [Actinomadura barringtoniae]|uniref:Sigma-70 family RNA polymerase sigma factor n=1 Tax=Actinomadura barringtoniae TaxID=1427535 RepID=A0A939TCD6_9ACTN|nr:sigma-70 family RNA polymerase sigma factor [Actinomadura barringtoniae]MBO2454462.1 sigma-70 family RNA polymerase sigma factor [Actinomadura barringtoniae]